MISGAYSHNTSLFLGKRFKKLLSLSSCLSLSISFSVSLCLSQLCTTVLAHLPECVCVDVCEWKEDTWRWGKDGEKIGEQETGVRDFQLLVSPLFLALHFFPVPSLLWLDLHVRLWKNWPTLCFHYIFWFPPPRSGPLVRTRVPHLSESGPMENKREGHQQAFSRALTAPYNELIWLMLLKILSPLEMAPVEHMSVFLQWCAVARCQFPVGISEGISCESLGRSLLGASLHHWVPWGWGPILSMCKSQGGSSPNISRSHLELTSRGQEGWKIGDV